RCRRLHLSGPALPHGGRIPADAGGDCGFAITEAGDRDCGRALKALRSGRGAWRGRALSNAEAGRRHPELLSLCALSAIFGFFAVKGFLKRLTAKDAKRFAKIAKNYIRMSFARRAMGCCISCKSLFTRFSPYTHCSKFRESVANMGATLVYSKC